MDSQGSKRQQYEILVPVLVLIQAAARTVTGFLNLDVQSRQATPEGNSTRVFDLCLLIISVAIFISLGRWKYKGCLERVLPMRAENILNGEPSMVKSIKKKSSRRSRTLVHLFDPIGNRKVSVQF